MSHKSHYTRIIRRWHGHIGVVATVLLVFVVVTGIILNHEEGFRLDKREISSPWLMRWYGMHVEAPQTGYLMGDRYFSWEGDKWAIGSQALFGSSEYPVGAVKVGDIDYVATPSALYMYQADGQLLEKLEKQSLPAYPILALGKMGDSVVLQTPSAMLASPDGLTWRKAGTDLTWASMQPMPDDVRRQMGILLAPGLSLQRILMDVHSGRIFGRYGPWVVDLAAIAFLMLGISGVWIYWRSIKQGKLRHKQR